MIRFKLNGIQKEFSGDPQASLLSYLRETEGILSVKDGCSGQAACGACLLEVDGKPVLSCTKPMKKVEGSSIVTIEGFPEPLRQTLGRSFAEKGAVQCGFCSPGFLSRAKILLETNPDPTREEIIHALRFNLCRCTGYVKIIDAIEMAAEHIRQKKEVKINNPGRVGRRQPKYDAYAKAIGTGVFVGDMRLDGMLHGALRFSDHPRAKVLKIDITRAQTLPGVVRVFTGKDIPGERLVGVIHQDWPVMVVEGETTRYIGDVLAGVVADTEAIARKAAQLIEVDYEICDPLTDVLAAEESPIAVHPGGNLLCASNIRRGEDIHKVLSSSAHVVEGTYKTQMVEHGFLETEAAVARPQKTGGIEIFVQSQGVYEDREQLARILDIPAESVKVNLVPSGGGFGGKEDLTVQGHAALFSLHLQEPVMIRLSRPESIRMHPKRHPFHMQYKLGCDENGMLTGLYARIIGDTGAYASLGGEVLERAAGHATAAYFVPHVDIQAKAVYTNNIPCGAMRGFGVNQVTFAMESCVDDLCAQAGFDPWQFRYDNALDTGKVTATGQILGEGVGIRATLLAVKDDFYNAVYAGLACGIKNCGIGNGVLEESGVKIEIKSEDHVVIQHGWTEMGQGVDTVALQILCEETGIEDPSIIEVMVTTESKARAGMTTASRATFLLGNAIIKACQALKEDLKTKTLKELSGQSYSATWICDWTTQLGEPGEVITHYAYGYATHLVVLDSEGKVDSVVAAHDVGRVINPTLLEGQVEGAVVMGLGYALSEEVPMEKGLLKTDRYGKLGIPRIKNLPKIVVKGLEVKDPLGPYGAKGVGEIGTIPTAAAVANAFYAFDKKRRYELPMRRKK